MKNFIRSFFCREQTPSGYDQRLVELREVFDSLAPCFSCKGRFDKDDLQIRWVGTARLDDNGGVEQPVFEEVLYCEACKPKAAILFTLEAGATGEYLDDRHFEVKDGWFQELDDETGENRYVLSLEEYERSYCQGCGNPTELSKCKVCHPPKQAKICIV